MADGIEVGHGYIAISASARDAVRQIDREFTGAMPRTGKKASQGLGGAFLGGMKSVAGPLAALFAVDKIKDFFADANAEARESQKVGATTTQIIKSTGGAAKITAAQVGELATAISNKTGKDDEAIQKGANLLLTFKRVRNEAGKGNDVFSRATQSAVDLSAAGFGSIESASKMLGKALNDPLKGISALGRAGVTFTDQQKDQIKTLVKSGDVLGAQKIIMKEVESQVGGVAAASATAGEKMSVAFGNFKEQVGTALLPLIDRLATFVTTKLIPPLSRFVSFLSANAGPAFARVSAAVAALFGGITRGAPAASFLQTKLVPALLGIVGAGQRLGAVVLPIVRQVAAAFLREWPKIQPIVMDIFSTIGGIVVDVMALVQKRIQVVTAVIQFIWARWGKQITTIVVSVFKTVYSVIAGAMKVVGGIVKIITGLMTGDWAKAGQGIKQIVGGIRQIVVAIWQNIRTQIQAILGGLLSNLLGRWSGFLAWTRGTLRAGLGRIRDFVLDPIRGARDALKGVLDAISGKFRSAVTAIGLAWDGLREKAKAPVRFVITTVINGLVGAFNKIAHAVGAAGIAQVGLPPGFHGGGLLDGPAGLRDNMLAVASSGMPIARVEPKEYVMPRWMSPLFPIIESFRRAGKLPRFAQGGLVGGAGRFTDRFAARLLQAQKMLGARFSIFQRGFRPPTSYSGTSHAGDAVDLAPVTARVVAILRSLAIAAWRRGPKQGFTPHIHAVPLPGSGSAGGSGVWQAQDYLHGGDGLGGRDYEKRGGALAKIAEFLKAGFDSVFAWLKNLIKDPLAKLKSLAANPFAQMAGKFPGMVAEGMLAKAKSFDSGGYLQPGMNLAWNGTGRPEPVGHHLGSGAVIQQTFPASMDPTQAAAVAGSRVVASLRARGVG